MNERQHEIELKIDGTTADAVWDALTVPEEIVRWFTPVARVEPGVGGALHPTWADGTEGSHEIIEWEPGRRLVLSGRGQRIEFDIAATGGGVTLRLVHSGFSADSSFDDEFNGAFGGWSTYLAILRYVLTEKRGEPIEQISRFAMIERERDRIWPIDVKMPIAEIAQPAKGYLVASLPELDDSPLAMFCEGFGGQTFVTISAYLCGPARQHSDRVRAHIDGLIESLKE